MNAQAAAIAPPRSRRRAPSLASRCINILGPLVMIMLLCLVVAIAEPSYFGISNLMIILQDASRSMIVGMALTLVITGRGIDLPMGATAPRASTR